MGLFRKRTTINFLPPRPWVLPDLFPQELVNINADVLLDAIGQHPTEGRADHALPTAMSLDPQGNVRFDFAGAPLAYLKPDLVQYYAEGLTRLAHDGRYAVATISAPGRTSKLFGSASALLGGRPNFIPFNQPPAGIPVTSETDIRVTASDLYRSTIREIRGYGEYVPGWVVLCEDGDDVAVHLPKPYEEGIGAKVGRIFKKDLPAARGHIAGGPVAAHAKIYWDYEEAKLELGWPFGYTDA